MANIQNMKNQGSIIAKKRKQRDWSKVFALPTISQAAPVAANPAGLRLKLFDYQLRSLHRMCEIEEAGCINLPAGSGTQEHCFRGGVIADVVGMGKTAQLIALFLARPGRNLVITPGHLCMQWGEELTKFAGDQLSVMVIDPGSAQNHRHLFDSTDVVIVSLEYITTPGVSDTLFASRWRRVVYDECHEVIALSSTAQIERLEQLCAAANNVGAIFAMLQPNEISEQQDRLNRCGAWFRYGA